MSTVTELRQDAQIIFLSDLIRERERRRAAEWERARALHPAGKGRPTDPDEVA